MALTFSITWDYRCPFARIAHEHVLTGLADGADWDVTFVPFSLGQVHVAEGETDIWERPEDDTGLLALQAGVTVRDRYPDAFRAVHRGLFDLRHVHSGQLNDEAAVRAVLTEHGVDDDAVFATIADGSALETIRKEHEAAAAGHDVWGVPTFIVGDQATFVRLMHTPGDDGALARSTVERVVDLVGGWPDLNEFKHTSIPR
jgi:2-hydroxychromene-2-carboxylate isomerase